MVSGDHFNTSKLFAGKKQKWLPLYRRLIARLNSIPGIEIILRESAFLISGTKSAARNPKKISRVKLGMIRIMSNGLEMGLFLGDVPVKSSRFTPVSRSRLKVSHRSLISSPSEIDEEFISWVKIALFQARIATRRST